MPTSSGLTSQGVTSRPPTSQGPTSAAPTFRAPISAVPTCLAPSSPVLTSQAPTFKASTSRASLPVAGQPVHDNGDTQNQICNLLRRTFESRLHPATHILILIPVDLASEPSGSSLNYAMTLEAADDPGSRGGGQGARRV